MVVQLLPVKVPSGTATERTTAWQPVPAAAVTKRTCRLPPVLAALSLYASSTPARYVRNDGRYRLYRSGWLASRTYSTSTRLPVMPSPSQRMGLATATAAATEAGTGCGASIGAPAGNGSRRTSDDGSGDGAA